MFKSNESLKNRLIVIGVIVGIFLLIVGVGVGEFFIKRWFHYQVYYKGMVERVITPLEKRIDGLEKRVSELERKSGKGQEF